MASTIDGEFTARQRLLSLAAVLSTSFGTGISFGIGFPLISLTFEMWGQPSWMIGLAGAAPPFAILLALPIAPRVIAKLGSVRAIALGCLIGGLGFVALGLFQSPWAWIAIRVLMSAGFAMPWLAGETWINAVAREETRGRVIAVYAMVFFTGYAVGPILLQALGLVWPWPFLAAAIVTGLSGLPIVLGRRLAPPTTHGSSVNVASALRMSPVAMVGAFIGGFSEITILSLIPNVALAGGWSEQLALTMLTVTTLGGIVLQYPIGWLSDLMSRFTMMVAFVVIFIALALALPFALNDTVAGLVTAFLIGGVILGFYALGLAIIGERVSGADLAAANAAFIIMYQCGGLVGPLFAGIAMTDNAVQGFVAIVIVTMAITGPALLIFDRIERRRARAQA
ncbi:MFS transporter [Hyphomicrobium sp. 99]|uniref:MFS transporter n=1 Tax=Hyphomicrobium sp. 99 TaxID=1163419 RepID=UPI0005F7EEA1|nr:MFS transporter [Hyphomicrobium sp. 99]